MNTEPYNANDLSFLLSRSLDDDLSPDERRLEEALRESPQLQREWQQLQSIDRLVCRWGQRGYEADAEAFAGLTIAEVGGAAGDSDFAQVDSLLRRWGAGVPTGDRDLVDNVLRAIGGKRRKLATRSLVFRLGVPLAAAAAIALAVVAPWFQMPPTSTYVAWGPQVSVPASVRPQLEVYFEQSPEVPVEDMAEATFGYMTIGVEPTVGADEGSSL